MTNETQPCRVVGKAKTSAGETNLVSGITSIVEHIRQDAYDGDFDPVLERHSLTALAVTGQVQQPAFLCQPGSVLHQQICGIYLGLLLNQLQAAQA